MRTGTTAGVAASTTRQLCRSAARVYLDGASRYAIMRLLGRRPDRRSPVAYTQAHSPAISSSSNQITAQHWVVVHALQHALGQDAACGARLPGHSSWVRSFDGAVRHARPVHRPLPLPSLRCPASHAEPAPCVLQFIRSCPVNAQRTSHRELLTSTHFSALARSDDAVRAEGRRPGADDMLSLIHI